MRRGQTLDGLKGMHKRIAQGGGVAGGDDYEDRTTSGKSGGVRDTNTAATDRASLREREGGGEETEEGERQ